MNRIYRIVFNHALGIPQVVSELARAPGGQTTKDGSARASRLKPLALGCALALALVAPLWSTDARADGGSSTTLNYWNANGQASATQPGGGSGTWSATSPTWSDASGSTTSVMQPQPGFGIFGGAAGTVTVDDSAGYVLATGVQFASDGYVMTGDVLDLVSGNGTDTPVICVGDGSSTSAGWTATLHNPLYASVGLGLYSGNGFNKTGLGTLILDGGIFTNHGVIISGGQLVVAPALSTTYVSSITGTLGSPAAVDAAGNSGGAGVSMTSGTGFTSGTGVSVLGGMGSSGGVSGYTGLAGGSGGAGVDGHAGNVNVNNDGSIKGGVGGWGGNFVGYAPITGGVGGVGGAGVDGGGNANVDNGGYIAGGTGGSGGSTGPYGGTSGAGGIGGAGIALGANSTLVNRGAGSIHGGIGGYGGSSSVTSNPPTAPDGAYDVTGGIGGAGGAGASLGNASTLTNGGSIRGGDGSSNGSAVVFLSSSGSSSFNATEGAGGAGGAGAILGSGATLTNTGNIIAGKGGSGGSSVGALIYLFNSTTGSVQANGGAGGNGGEGVNMASGANLINQAGAYIGGGAGGAGGVRGTAINGNALYYGNSGAGGNGGSGLVLSDNFQASNAGTIYGGSGGVGGGVPQSGLTWPGTFASAGNGGNGGNGAAGLAAGRGDFDNSSYIIGGDGGNGGSLSVNNEQIAGGAGGAGGNAGAGIYSAGGLNLTNSSSGQIFGGYGGTGGNGGYGNGDYNGLSTATAGGAGGVGGQGGAGANLGRGSSLTNAGSITGGRGGVGGIGGYGDYVASTAMGAPGGNGGAGGTGASGVTGTGFVLINSGTVTAGNGGNGGTGSASYSQLAASGNGGQGGVGGAGISGTDFTLTNSGTVTGGNGGQGGDGGASFALAGTSGNGGNGGMGGAGVSGSGFMLTNTGSIVGGNGGVAGQAGAPSNGAQAGNNGNGSSAGIGVVATGGSTVINAGTIAGGLNADGTQADAVDFSGGGNTLVMAANSHFIGNVVSTSGQTNGGDMFALGGNTDASFDLGTLGAAGGGTAIQGFTQLGKTGTSTWTLTGTGNASQSWTIANGSLIGNTDSIVGNVTFAPAQGNSANLTFDQSTNGIYNGAISGDGSLTKTGNGTLTLTGNNAYTGTTTIASGMIAFSSADTATYGGVIGGSGSVAQIGSGTLILNGANTYTGGTTVQSGTLEVGDENHTGASIQNNVTVDAGATLRGHGTINGDVTSDGMVWPGGSVGMLTINGNYTQNADATLQIDVTPTEASQLLVHGTASLGGKLNLIYAPGTYDSATYALVKADALTGTFASTTSSGSVPTALAPTISYTATQADLVLTSPIVVAPRDSSVYANFMRTASLVGQQSMTTVLAATLRPAETACGGTPTQANMLTSSCSNGVWAQYNGSSNELTGSQGLNSTTFGLQAGADVAMSEWLHMGVEAGLDRINGNDHNGGVGHVDNVHGGVYAFANAGPLVVSGTIDVAHGSYRLSRDTGAGHAVSSPDGDTTAAALQVAWPMRAAQWQVTPVVGVLYQHQSLDGFNETVNSISPLASSFALQGRDSTYNSTQPYAAVSFTRPFTAGHISYVPQFNVGYRYDTRNGAGPIVTAFSQDGTRFALRGDAMGRGVATVGARITAQGGASWSLYLDYQGQFASHLNDNALSVGFTKHF